MLLLCGRNQNQQIQYDSEISKFIKVDENMTKQCEDATNNNNPEEHFEKRKPGKPVTKIAVNETLFYIEISYTN